MNNNIVWHNQSVSKSNREKIKGHSGCCIWFTGLSGSGKSTIANALELELNKRKIHTYLLDGDNIRHGLNNDLGFSEEDRVENIRRIGEVAKLFVDAGVIVITAFISPFIKDRDSIRASFQNINFIEVFVDCKLETCEKRDPKGLYKKARNGEIKDFTGINSPYEPPLKPELQIKNNDDDDVNRNVEKVIQYLNKNKIIS
ncbi:MAG: adenylyl-sulfate kinase [Ignavibacteriaceae bacterium]